MAEGGAAALLLDLPKAVKLVTGRCGGPVGRGAHPKTEGFMDEHLKDYSPIALRERLVRDGLPGYRADQIAAWLYGRGVEDPHAMTDLDRELREHLAARWRTRALEIEDAGVVGRQHGIALAVAAGVRRGRGADPGLERSRFEFERPGGGDHPLRVHAEGSHGGCCPAAALIHIGAEFLH